MSYKELNPVIAINILNFDLFSLTDRFHTTYHLYEDMEKLKLTDVMEFHFIEMTELIRDWQANKSDPGMTYLPGGCYCSAWLTAEMVRYMKIFSRNWRQLR